MLYLYKCMLALWSNLSFEQWFSPARNLNLTLSKLWGSWLWLDFVSKCNTGVCFCTVFSVLHARCLQHYSLLAPGSIHRSMTGTCESSSTSGDSTASDLFSSAALLRYSPKICSKILTGDLETRWEQWKAGTLLHLYVIFILILTCQTDGTQWFPFPGVF